MTFKLVIIISPKPQIEATQQKFMTDVSQTTELTSARQQLALNALRLDEVRQHVIVRPAVAAAQQRRPAVVVGATAARVHHVVDETAAAQRFSARPQNLL